MFKREKSNVKGLDLFRINFSNIGASWSIDGYNL